MQERNLARSIALVLGVVVGLTVLASVAGYVFGAVSQLAGITIRWWMISLFIIGVIAAVGTFFVPVAVTWPKAIRIITRSLTFAVILVFGSYYTVILALTIHGK